MSEGLAQGPYVVARAGVKPMTLQTKGVDSTKAPHVPHLIKIHAVLCVNICQVLYQNRAHAGRFDLEKMTKK